MAGKTSGLGCPLPPACASRVGRARPATLSAEGGEGGGLSAWGNRSGRLPAPFREVEWCAGGGRLCPPSDGLMRALAGPRCHSRSGSAVAGTWGEEAERELGAAVAEPAGEG